MSKEKRPRIRLAGLRSQKACFSVDTLSCSGGLAPRLRNYVNVTNALTLQTLLLKLPELDSTSVAKSVEVYPKCTQGDMGNGKCPV